VELKIVVLSKIVEVEVDVGNSVLVEISMLVDSNGVEISMLNSLVVKIDVGNSVLGVKEL
jgi:hypothetical protein